MADVVVVDTSILLNVLEIPKMSDQNDEVLVELKEHIESQNQLVLPLATVLETGNHIAQNGDGRQRRECATRLVEVVRKAVEESIPWGLAWRPEDRQELLRWLDDFPDSATRGVGFGDHSIEKVWRSLCDELPGSRVWVWSLDRHLQGLDRSP